MSSSAKTGFNPGKTVNQAHRQTNNNNRGTDLKIMPKLAYRKTVFQDGFIRSPRRMFGGKPKHYQRYSLNFGSTVKLSLKPFRNRRENKTTWKRQCSQ